MKAVKTLPLVLAFPLLISPILAEDSSLPYLKGVTAVKVNIAVSNELVAGGVAGAQLRTQVELQLRSAGLKVDRSLESPILEIEITGVRSTADNYSAYVSVAVSDKVKVLRNGAEMIAYIWGPDLRINYFPDRQDLDHDLRETTKNKVDKFLNVWLQHNPR